MSGASAYLLETLVTLLGVVAVAVLVLVGARRLGLGGASGPMEMLGRLPLDTRRAIYLVRVGKQVLVVGSSEAGLTKLGEVPDGELPAEAEAPKKRFGDLLAGFAKKGAP